MGDTGWRLPEQRRAGGAGRVPALDGVRGVAIIALLGYHGGWVSGGTRGVTTFFVLSGYLITRLLLAEHDRYGSVSLRGFYLRRLGRLGPGLVISATVLAVGLVTVQDPGEVAWRWTVTMLQGANLVEAFGGQVTMGPFSAYWSLATEEQFYVIWPGILMLMLARGSRRRVVALLLAVLAIASLARLVVIGTGHLDQVYFAPWFRLDAIAAGCLVALLPAPRPRRWLGLAGLALLLWLMADVDGLGRNAYIALGQPVTIIAAGILLVHGPAIGWVLGNRVLVHVGRISYGLYVWHLVVMGLDAAGVVPLPGWSWLPVSVALAEVSWWGLERRCIAWTHHRTRRADPALARGIESDRTRLAIT